MKIHGTAKGGALSKKDFGVAFGGAAAPSEPMAWFDTGYSGSEPTISTTTTDDDTTQPTGDSAGGGGFPNGNALSTETGDLKIKIVGTFGEGGTISNTLIGLTTKTTAGSISDVCMAWGNTYVIANIQFLEGDVCRANAASGSDTACENGDILEIKRDGTTLTFYVNESSFYTATIASAEDYQVFSSSSDGATGKHIFV